MKYSILLLVLTVVGQTKIDSIQIKDFPTTGLPTTQGVCTGPVVRFVDTKTLIIGQNWTVDNPCNLYFQIEAEPPIESGLSIKSIKWSSTVKLTATASMDDLLFIWVAAPDFPATMAKLTIGVMNTAVIDCSTIGAMPDSSCIIAPVQGPPRVFPKGTIPVAMIPIVAGKFSTTVHDLLGMHRQVTFGPNVKLSVTFKDGVYLYQVAQ